MGSLNERRLYRIAHSVSHRTLDELSFLIGRSPRDDFARTRIRRRALSIGTLAMSSSGVAGRDDDDDDDGAGKNQAE
jgi:hypothetical protein